MQQTSSGEFEIGSALGRHPYAITIAMSLEFEKQIHRSPRSGVGIPFRQGLLYFARLRNSLTGSSTSGNARGEAFSPAFTVRLDSSARFEHAGFRHAIIISNAEPMLCLHQHALQLIDLRPDYNFVSVDRSVKDRH